MAGFQLATIDNVVEHAPLMLEEQGIPAEAMALLNPRSLVGVASDGRDLGSLLTLPDLTDYQFDRIVATQLQDVARAAAAIERAVRPEVTHYVRVLNLPSCGRCIILAGKPLRSDVAFKRHPGCDCGALATTERLAERQTTDPAEAFELMTAAERQKAFTKAGAEAIELGADPSRVVNTRAGMSTAQVNLRGVGDRWSASGRLTQVDVYGQQLYTTAEAVGKRRVRLMPESILEIADDRQDAIRLLRSHGYITT